MARYQTPPPRVRALSPASPQRTGEIIVKLVTVGGTDLGELKITRETQLIDVYDKLMSALGGSMGYTYEPRLVSPRKIAFDGAYQYPFLFASDGDVYTLIKAKMRDTAYVDRNRRRRRSERVFLGED